MNVFTHKICGCLLQTWLNLVEVSPNTLGKIDIDSSQLLKVDNKRRGVFVFVVFNIIGKFLKADGYHQNTNIIHIHILVIP